MLRAFFLAIFLTFLSVFNATISGANERPHRWIPSGDVRSLHAALNAQRATFHLRTLRLDPRLCAIADAYAHQMAARGFFGHTAPDGRTLFDRLADGHVRVQWAAENIAMDRDPASAARALWESAPHRANILNPHYAGVGIGVARQAGSEIFVEDFSN